MPLDQPGWIVILNGAPRSGKSSIATAIQEKLDGLWINLGVDVYRQASPAAIQPSIGLRPGGERPDIEAHLPLLFAALYESVAAHSRLGLNVVMDMGHHDAHARRLDLLPESLRRLDGLPVLVVGVRCPLAVILERRSHAAPGRDGVYARSCAGEPVPAPILAWQRDVHRPGLYDLELDTSDMSPAAAAVLIGSALRDGLTRPTAAQRIIRTHVGSVQQRPSA